MAVFAEQFDFRFGQRLSVTKQLNFDVAVLGRGDHGLQSSPGPRIAGPSFRVILWQVFDVVGQLHSVVQTVGDRASDLVAFRNRLWTLDADQVVCFDRFHLNCFASRRCVGAVQLNLLNRFGHGVSAIVG